MFEKIKKYFKNKNEVIAVYLSGSYPRNQNRPASDVDIGMFFGKAAVQDYQKKETDRFWSSPVKHFSSV